MGILAIQVKTEGVGSEEPVINPLGESRNGPIEARRPRPSPGGERPDEKLRQAMWVPQEGIVNDGFLVVDDEGAAEGIQITPGGQHGHYEKGHPRPRPTLHLPLLHTNLEGWVKSFPEISSLLNIAETVKC